MMLRPVAALVVTFSFALLARAGERAGERIDRRIVDTVQTGDPTSEVMHGYAGERTTTGETNGQSWRQTSSWMHYTLKTFEDTPVTVACTFLSTGEAARQYDVVVEDSVIATRTFESAPGSTPVVVELQVPFAITKGKSHIAVIVRARGGPTPALHMLRTIQEHFEQQDVRQNAR